MKVSETTQKVYDGVSAILNQHGQNLSKAQAYAIESMLETVEESTEKRCCDQTTQILAKKDMLVKEATDRAVVGADEATVKKIDQMVESRIAQLKKELPQIMDYAKLKKLSDCVETIKECVGYASDDQVEKVASESAKMLHSTKSLIDTQAKTISEKTASLSESTKAIRELKEKIKQRQGVLEAKDKQIVESTKKNSELVNTVQNLQKKVDESKKLNESIEEKRKTEALRFYLEQKISSYPKYEAALLRKHFQNAKSRAEIDENFGKALAMVSEKRDAMRTVQAIPVAKVNPVVAEAKQKISGETIVGESGGLTAEDIEALNDESFVDIDSDTISNEDMQRWISRL